MQQSNEVNALCQNIKMLRERNGLSKKEMAEIMGIGAASLAKIELDILPSRFRTETMLKLCKRFRIKPSKLFCAHDEWDSYNSAKDVPPPL